MPSKRNAPNVLPNVMRHLAELEYRRAARMQSSETDDRSRSPSRSRQSLSANPHPFRPDSPGAMLPGPSMSFERNAGSSQPVLHDTSRPREHHDTGWSYPASTSQLKPTTMIPARTAERRMGTSLDVTEYLDPELPGSEGNEWVGRAGGGDTMIGRPSASRARRQPRMTFEDPRERYQTSDQGQG